MVGSLEGGGYLASNLYRKNEVDSPLTYQEERFVNALVEGVSLHDAYLLAYPHMIKYTSQTIRKHAKELAKRSDIREAREIAEKEYTDSLANMKEWNRDLAVHSFRFVINQGMQDINNARISKEMRLSHLTEEIQVIQERIDKLEHAEDTGLVEEELQKAKMELAERYSEFLDVKADRISDRSTNDAIIRAASELNKMSGIDGTSLNTGTEIKFIGEDRIED